MERNDRGWYIEDTRQLHPGDIIEAGLTRRRWHALVIGSRMTLMGEIVEAIMPDGEIMETSSARLAGERAVIIGNMPLDKVVQDILCAAGIKEEKDE